MNVKCPGMGWDGHGQFEMTEVSLSLGSCHVCQKMQIHPCAKSTLIHT